MNVCVILLLIWIVLNIAMLFALIYTDCFESYGVSWLNPLVIYKYNRINWFGATLLALIANVVFVPYAAFYWLYKLCTIGRK